DEWGKHCTRVRISTEGFKVQSCDSLFNGFGSLVDVDLTNIDTSNVSSFKNMFRECSSLENCNLSSLDTSNVNQDGYYAMFQETSSLKNLDISNFTPGVDARFMFKDSGIESLTMPVGFIGSTTKKIDSMFVNTSIKVLDFSSFDFSSVTSYDNAFNCTGTTKIILPSSGRAKSIGLPLGNANKHWVAFTDGGKVASVHSTTSLIDQGDTIDGAGTYLVPGYTIGDLTIDNDGIDLTYDGTSKDYNPVVKIDSVTLTKDANYQITKGGNDIHVCTDAGEDGAYYTLTAKQTNSYPIYGDVKYYFDIKPLDIEVDLSDYIDDLKITKSYDGTNEYSGDPIELTIDCNLSVSDELKLILVPTFSDETLGDKKDVTYNVTLDSIVGAGHVGNVSDYNLILTNGDADNNVTLEEAGEITKSAITTLEFDNDKFSYTGNEIEPVITVINIDGTVISNDDLEITYDPSEKINCGTYEVTVTAKEDSNYSGTLKKSYKINKRTITVDLSDYEDVLESDENSKKEYDGTNNAIDTIITLDTDETNTCETIDLTISGIYNRSDCAGASNITRQLKSFEVKDGMKDNSNYQIFSSSLVTDGTIAPKELSMDYSLIDDEVIEKLVDGNSNVIWSNKTVNKQVKLSGALHEQAIVNVTGSYDDSNIGLNKDVTLMAELTSDSINANYSLKEDTKVLLTKGNIKSKTFTKDDITVSDVFYTGSIASPSVTVKVDSYTLAENIDYTLETTNVSVTDDAEIVVKGINNFNGTQITKKYKIKKREINVNLSDYELTTVMTEDKAYDGNNKASDIEITLGTDITNTNEEIKLVVSGTYNDKDSDKANKIARALKSFEVLDGLCDSSNYDVNVTPCDVTGTITKVNVLMDFSKVTETISKVYDGDNKVLWQSNNSNTLQIELDGITDDTLEVEKVKINVTGLYDDETINVSKAVTLTAELDDNDINKNYNFETVNDDTFTGSIIAKTFALDDITVSDVTYTGSIGAPSVTVTGLTLGTDFETVTTNIDATDSAIVTVKGINDYIGTSFDVNYKINKKQINVDLSSDDYKTLLGTTKEYDGNTNAEVKEIELGSDVTNNSEVIKLTISGTYNSKEVLYANKIRRTLNGITVSGGQEKSDNYLINCPDKDIDGTITKKIIDCNYDEITESGITKAYDGNNNVIFSNKEKTIELNLEGVNSETVTVIVSGSYDDETVNDDKVVTLNATLKTNITNSNYEISDETKTKVTTGDIKMIVIDESKITVKDVTYNGTVIKPVVTIKGLVEDEDYEVIATEVNANDNAEVTIKGIGNYSGTYTKKYKINKKPITIDLSDSMFSSKLNNTKTYDGTVSASDKEIEITQTILQVPGDKIKLVIKGTYASSDSNEGASPIVITNTYDSYTVVSGNTGSNYQVTCDSVTSDGYINKKVIDMDYDAFDSVYTSTITKVANGDNKVSFGGSDTYPVELDGANGEKVKVNVSGTYSDKEVGNDKQVTLTASLSSDDVNKNYLLNSSTISKSSYKGNITALGIDESKIHVSDTTYTGLLATPTVTIDGLTKDVDYTYTVEGINAGSGKVKFTGLNDYQGSNPETPFTISKKDVSVNLSTYSASYTNEKTYDGTNVLSDYTITDIATGISGETISLTITQTYANSSAGTSDITRSYKSFSVSGGMASSDNYNLTVTPYTISGTINKKDVSMDYSSIDSEINKVVDGTDTVYFSEGVTTKEVTLDTGIASEQIKVNVTGKYADSNIGDNKVITLTASLVDSLTHPANANYNLTNTTNNTQSKGNITNMGITQSMINVTDTTYTGVLAIPTVTVTGLTLDTDYTYEVSGTEAGTGTVTVTGKNFYAGSNCSKDFTINKKDITVNLSDYADRYTNTKTYDGTTNLDNFIIENIEGVNGEKINVTITQSFTSSDAGDSTINRAYDSYTVTGGKANINNYNLTVNPDNGRSATISKRDIAMDYSSIDSEINKVVDGTDTVYFSEGVTSKEVTLDTGIGSEQIKANATGTYADSSIGDNKVITLVATLVSDTLHSANKNYNLTNTSNNTNSKGNITSKGITESMITVSDTEYTGSLANPTVTVTGLTFDTDYTYTVSGVNAGTNAGKVTVTGKGDYTGSSCDKTFTIKKKDLTINLNDSSFLSSYTNTKVYDGTTTLSDYVLENVSTGITGETLNITMSQAFDSSYAGSTTIDRIYKSFTVSGGNEKTDNYNLVVNDYLDCPATITKRDVSMDFSSITSQIDKLVDGNNTVYFASEVTTKEVEIETGINSETVKANVTGTYTDSSIGNDKVITLVATLLSDTLHSANKNYNLTNTTNNTQSKGNIVSKGITTDLVTVTDTTYTGVLANPTVTVTGLTLDTDYTVSVTGTEAGTGKVTITGTGDYAGSSLDVNFTINKFAKTINIADYADSFTNEKTYDGTTNFNNFTIENIEGVNGEKINVTITQSFTSSDAGASTIDRAFDSYTVTGGMANINNYNLTVNSDLGRSATINKKDVAMDFSSISTQIDKIVDGNNNVYFSEGVTTKEVTLAKGINNEDIKVNVTGTYADSSIGDNKVITLNASLVDSETFSNNKNYNLTNTSDSTHSKGNIISKGIVDSIVTVTDTTYTGLLATPVVTVTGLTLDTDYTYQVTGIDAGTGKVTITGKGDYAGSNLDKEFTINKKDVTVELSDASIISKYTNTKVYDGVLDASDLVLLNIPTGIDGETFNITITQKYSSIDVGDSSIDRAYKSYTVSGGRSNASNYNLSVNSDLARSATITAKEISMDYSSIETQINKVVDGNNKVYFDGINDYKEVEINTGINSDKIKVKVTGTYEKSTLDNDIAITLNAELVDSTSYPSNKNYTLTNTSNSDHSKGNIESKGLSETAVSVSDTVYTGTVAVPVVTVSGLTLNTDYTYTVTGTNAGTNAGKVVVTGIGDYLGNQVTKYFTIKPKELDNTVLTNTSVKLEYTDKETVTKYTDGVQSTYTSLSDKTLKPYFVDLDNSDTSSNVIYFEYDKANSRFNKLVTTKTNSSDSDKNEISLSLTKVVSTNTNYKLKDNTPVSLLINDGYLVDNTKPTFTSLNILVNDSNVTKLKNGNNVEVRLTLSEQIDDTNLSSLTNKKVTIKSLDETFSKDSTSVSYNKLDPSNTYLSFIIPMSGIDKIYEGIKLELNLDDGLSDIPGNELIKTLPSNLDLSNYKLLTDGFEVTINTTSSDLTEDDVIKFTIKFSSKELTSTIDNVKDAIKVYKDNTLVDKTKYTIDATKDTDDFDLFNLTVKKKDILPSDSTKKVVLKVEVPDESVIDSDSLKVIGAYKEITVKNKEKMPEPQPQGGGGTGSTSTITVVSGDVQTVNPGDPNYIPSANSKHKAYINGYDDGTFKPMNNMTRAEFSKIASSISDNFKMEQDINYYQGQYIDVPTNEWYTNYIGYVTQVGLMGGDEDGFRPNQNVTRAEVAVVLSKMYSLPLMDGQNVIDTTKYDEELKGEWFEESLTKMIKAGYLKGYDDGTIRPNASITRAEIVILVNRVNQRTGIDVSGFVNRFSDINQNDWYYNDIIEASANY
ncbi:MAG: YDG domain-containing protein, partial [Clostridia bacterium]|nr:YDG domain-containing protein [Clostridia bacterium]